MAADDRDGAILASLAVQTAMQQARDALLHNNSKAAVEALEGQLPRADGNEKYLVLLRNAYRAYIRELRLRNNEPQAQVYLKRLSILDPTAATEFRSPARAAGNAPPTPAAGPPAEKAAAPAASASTATPAAAPRIVARGYSEQEDDPFRPATEARGTGSDLLARAEQEFVRRNYREAAALYAKANELDRRATDVCRERWAYCKLHDVVERLNQPQGSAAYGELEAEIRKAQELAPRLAYARELLLEIDRRRGSAGAPREAVRPSVRVVVRHGERTPEGWNVAESTNFRVFHTQTREFAEQAAQVAERTRSEMQVKWFGAGGDVWNPRCDIFLFPSGKDYSRATGAPAASPGHSSFNMDQGRVLSRRIDLHCDDPNLLVAVLPHETTHTVLAGNFGVHQVPRWADEGMAVLTEPRDKVERHLHNLPRHRQGGELFSLQQLVQMQDYPEPRYVGAFYAQSVSLVDFLVNEKGPAVFTRFVRDGLHGGYEASLQRHYGYRSFADLEQRWLAFAFGGRTVAKSVALSDR